MNITDAMRWRCATKVFDPSRRIPDSEFRQLLEVLRLSPSSYGLQPWKFVIVEDKDLREQLKPATRNQAQATEASHLIVFCKRTDVDEDYLAKYIGYVSQLREISKEKLQGYHDIMMRHLFGEYDEQKRDAWARNQIYIALGSLMTAAAVMKIDTCPIEGFVPEQYDEILQLPSRGLNAVVVCALGYRSEEDGYARLKKVRFPLADTMVYL